MIYATTSTTLALLHHTKVILYRVINLANGITALLISDLKDKVSRDDDDDVDGMSVQP